MTREEELLREAAEEIRSLRARNERQAIRLHAIDDMLCLLHGKPGIAEPQGMVPDVVFAIEKRIAELKKKRDEMPKETVM